MAPETATARVEIGAEPEPGIEKITQRERIEEARRYGNDYIKNNSLTVVGLARVLFRDEGDKKRTLLSRFLNRSGDLDPTEVVIAIETLRATIEGPHGIPQFIGFQETRAVKLLWAHAKDARDNRRLASAVTYSGFGKTEAAKEYRDRSDGDKEPPVRIVTCNALVYAEELVRRLALSLGVSAKGSPAMLLDTVANRLVGHSEFLIFDEANYLINDRTLNVLRYLYDTAGCGMLFLGSPSFAAAISARSVSPLATATPVHSGKDRAPAADGPLAFFASRLYNLVLPGVGDDEVVDIGERALKARLQPDAASKLCVLVNHSMQVLKRLLIELREIRLKQPTIRTIDAKMVDHAWSKVQSRRVVAA